MFSLVNYDFGQSWGVIVGKWTLEVYLLVIKLVEAEPSRNRMIPVRDNAAVFFSVRLLNLLVIITGPLAAIRWRGGVWLTSHPPVIDGGRTNLAGDSQATNQRARGPHALYCYWSAAAHTLVPAVPTGRTRSSGATLSGLPAQPLAPVLQAYSFIIVRKKKKYVLHDRKLLHTKFRCYNKQNLEHLKF